MKTTDEFFLKMTRRMAGAVSLHSFEIESLSWFKIAPCRFLNRDFVSRSAEARLLFRWNGSHRGTPLKTTQQHLFKIMKRILSILSILTILALSFAITAPAQAAKGAKKGKKGGADILATYDKNANGKIDGEEVDALKKDFAAGKPELKALDTNKDGTLSDEEVAAAGGGKKGKKGKKKKNK